MMHFVQQFRISEPANLADPEPNANANLAPDLNL